MPKKRKNDKQRDLKPVFHIFCEGAVTEPSYFENYLQLRYSGLKLIKVEECEKNSPRELVEECGVMKSEAPVGDVFWAVYDRESEHEISSARHQEARDLASRKGIHIAISNACFEVWILLHHQKNIPPHTCFSDIAKFDSFKKAFPSYEKGKLRPFTIDEIESARANAKSLNDQTISSADSKATAPHQWNPYTNVYELLDAIDEFANQLTTPK